METSRTVRIIADPSQARAQIAGLKSDFASLNNARVGGEGFSRLEGQLNGAASAAGKLGTQISAGARAATAANDNHASSLRGVSGALGQASQHGGALAKVLEEVRGKAASAIPEIGGMANKLIGLGPAAAVVGAVALGIAAIGKASIDAAAETQRWMAQLTTVTKSSQLAKESYAALVQFATKTPFDLGQSIQAFTKLRSLGLAATESRLTSFGNTASAMGRSLNQMIEAVADASTGEFERLKAFGITSKTQGDQVAFTFQGVTTKVGKNSTEITKYLEKIGNVNFAGAMDKQMDTLFGAFSNVGDAMQQAFSAIGSGKLGQSVKEIAQSLAGGISYITPFLASIGNLFGGIIEGVGQVFNGLTSMWSGFGYATTAQGLLTGLTVAFNLIGEGAEALGSIVGSVFGFMGQIVSNVGGMLWSTFAGVLPDIGDLFDFGTRSWANSIVGVLRAAKTVVDWLPRLFRVAVSDIVQMFGTLGTAMGNLLKGNFHAFDGIGAKLKADGASTVKALGATWKAAQAVYKDEKGADNAIKKLLGKNGTKPLLASGVDARPTPNKKDGDDDAAKKAKKLADFWTGLQNELDQAKLFGIELAKVTKEKELQKVLERDLTLAEKARVDGFVQDIANNKALTDLKKGALELDLKTAASQARALNLTDEQAKLQDALDAKTTQAKMDGVEVAGQAYQQELAAYRLSLLRNQAEEKRVALIKSAVETAKTYSPAYAAQSAVDDLGRKKDDFLKAFNTGQLADAWGKPLSAATRDAVVAGLDQGIRDAAQKPQFDALGVVAGGSVTAKAKLAELTAKNKLDAASKALEAAGLNPQQVKAATQEIANTYRSDMNAASRLVADEFADRMSAVADVLDRLGGMIGGKAGGAVSALGGSVGAFGDFKKNSQDVSDTLKKAFDPNGKSGLAGKLSDGFGKAMAGLGIGESIGKLGSAMGLRGTETGAKIGGTIGGLALGPLGAIGGAVVGGLISSLFHKPPSSNASFTKNADGSVGVGGISGSNATVKAAAGGAAGEVLNGLAKIASSIGGTLSGVPNLTIGTWDSKWRVADTVTSKALHSKNFTMGSNLHDFGADGEAEAVAYAIGQALKQGVITGLSDLAQKALGALDSDSAISFIQSWSSAMSDLKSMTDPVGAAIDDVITPLKALQATMVKVGASSADMAKLEEYRSVKLAAVLKEQTSSIRTFLDGLQGDDGGISKVNQMVTTVAKLRAYDADILAGKSIDQSAFQDLLNKGASLNKDLYGANTTPFADNVTMFQTYGQDLLDSITKNFNSAAGLDATAQAIHTQTDQVTASIGITNDLVSGTNERLDALINILGSGVGLGVLAKNGEYFGN